MMLRKRFTVPSLILVFGLMLSGCSLTAVPTMDPIALQATIDASVSQAMKTAAYNLTSTAASMPTSTFTITPTQEPAATATSKATATTTVLAPTATKTRNPSTQMATATTTPNAYSCTLISTSPVKSASININTVFNTVWKVKNTGTKTWEVGYVDLVYVSGTKMQTGADVYDVTTAVNKGGELTLTVEMRAPSAAGKYTDSFELKMEGISMCTLSVKIEAIAP